MLPLLSTISRISARRWQAAAALLCFAGSWSPRVEAQELFVPGERWSWGGTPSETWIPGKVRFGARDSWLFAGADFGERRLFLFDAHATSSPPSPHRERVMPAGTVGALDVATAAHGSALFSLSQETAPSGTGRITHIERYDALRGSNSFTPVWTRDLSFVGNANVRIVCDVLGEFVTAAIWDGSHLRVDRFDGESGALLASNSLVSGGLLEIRSSDDGTRVAISTATDIFVLDENLQPSFTHSNPLGAPSALAISGNGRVLAIGFLGRLEVWREGPFEDSWTFYLDQDAPNPLEIARRAALSRDGNSLSVAWWDAGNGVDLRFQCLRAPFTQALFERSIPGIPSGYQNLPQEVRMTPDGRRALFGSWGLGGTEPELMLVDLDLGFPVFEENLSGSVRGIDLDQSGTRIAVSMKESHANEVGSHGEIRMFDTGERELQANGGTEIGGTLSLRSRRPNSAGIGPGMTVYLVGPRLSEPLFFNGLGFLRVNRRISTLHFRSMDSEGNAALDLPLGNAGFARGQSVSAQALFRTPGSGMRLSESSVSFLIL